MGAPVVYASQDVPELGPLIERALAQPGDHEQVGLLPSKRVCSLTTA